MTLCQFVYLILYSVTILLIFVYTQLNSHCKLYIVRCTLYTSNSHIYIYSVQCSLNIEQCTTFYLSTPLSWMRIRRKDLDNSA